MFHSVRARDANVGAWSAWRDYMNATALVAVSQNPPDPVGLPTSFDRWAIRVSVDWDFIGSDNDASAASALALRVNGFTDLGQRVIIDEIHGGGSGYDPVPMIALAIPQFHSPSLVYLYLAPGKNISYAELDGSDDFPVITRGLEAGCGFLPEMYIPQPQAEASGDITGFIERWYRGPGDGKMPYLLELRQLLESSSPIHFVYPVIDRFYRGERKLKLKRAKFLDLVIERAARTYPQVHNAGFGTWIWDSTRLKDPNRAADLAKIHAHYYGGGYALTGRRYYASNPG